MLQTSDCAREGDKLAAEFLCDCRPCGRLRAGVIICNCKLLNLNGIRYQIIGLSLCVEESRYTELIIEQLISKDQLKDGTAQPSVVSGSTAWI
jgi:hypothetical protein